MVYLVQPDGVDFQLGQGGYGHFMGDDAVGLDLGVVPDPLEQTVGHAGRTPGAAGYFFQPFLVRLHLQYPRGAFHYTLQRCLVVKIESVNGAEPVPQGRTEQGVARGGAYHGKGGEVKPQALGAGSLADDDIQGVVLQGGVQYLFYRSVEAVDFIDEEDIMFFKIGKDGG
jgi:hypothetical protein